MANNWHQGSQYQYGGNGYQQFSASPAKRQNSNPPPVCIKCGGPHFLVNCPQSTQPAQVTGFAPPPLPYPQQSQQTSGPVQAYPQQGGQAQYSSYPSNQYGSSASQYSYSQPQQTYTAPTPTYTAPIQQQQYSRPANQATPYNQYSQNYTAPQAPSQAPVQYNGPAYPSNAQSYNNPGSSQYSAPVNTYQNQNTGNYGNPSFIPSISPAQPQAPSSQWGNRSSSSKPYFQKPHQNTATNKREFSRTPSQQNQQSKRSSRSMSQRITPGLPPSERDATTKRSVSVSQTLASQSPNVSSHPAPDSQPASRKTSTVAMLTDERSVASVKIESDDQPDQETEEGEVREGDEEEENFNWELEHIFEEPSRLETVALAQALALFFDVTAVPLVQSWSSNVPSVSRYARKDNLKEFIRGIRLAPNWVELKEDPAFQELDDDAEFIPLNELHAWMDVHHGRSITVDVIEEETEEPETNVKKRSRSKRDDLEQVDEQENIDQQIALEVATEDQEAEPPHKRQKNDQAEELDEIIMAPGGRTPVLMGRGGTPCLPTTDAAWAVEPGETAASPVDPTEYLLNSLGVSGSPKPVKKEPVPSCQPSEEAAQTSTQTENFSHSLPQGPPSNLSNPSVQNMAQNMPHSLGRPSASGPQHNPQHGQSASYGNNHASNVPYSQSPHQYNPSAPPQYGPSTNAPYGNGQPQNINGQYMNGQVHNVNGSIQNMNGPPQNMNGLPQNMNGPPQNMNGPPQNYGPPQYTNGPPQYGAQNGVNYPAGPTNTYPQGQPQWGAQQNPSSTGAPQYNAPQQYNSYGQYQNDAYGNNQYGPPQDQYGNQHAAPYNQGPSQYNPGNAPFGGQGQGQYGPIPQSGPVQYGPTAYGPTPYHNQPQYQANAVGAYGNGPPSNAFNNSQYQTLPAAANYAPNQHQQQYGNVPNGQAPRQDSGYASARGSYSNGPQGNGPQGNGPYGNGAYSNESGQNAPGPNGFHNHNGGPQTLTHPSQAAETPANQQDASKNENQPLKPDVKKAAINSESPETGEISSPGTPLSPTSALILGKLVRKPSKKTKDEKTTLKKAKKRPAPVVDEAYSRRW